MLLWTTRKRKAAHVEPACSYVDALYWGFGGFEFGLLSSFGWRTFHRPLVFLAILGLVGALITSWLPITPVQKRQSSR
jgi:hypothetical protein